VVASKQDKYLSFGAQIFKFCCSSFQVCELEYLCHVA
jgi:hypothetical protein